MTLLKRLGALLCLLPGIGLFAADAPLVLTNHLGYELDAAKKAVIRSHAGDPFSRFEVRTWPGDAVAFEGGIGPGTPVDKWKDWVFWGLDFTGLRTEGDYTLHCYGGGRVVRSLPFKVQRLILERNTLSNSIAWFKTQRSSGFLDKADRNAPFRGSGRRIDAHGGWYDATGDYGKHFTQLSGTSFFNTQQIPLTAYSLFRTLDILTARDDVNFAQMRRRLLDEALYGADYLVRFRDPKASFYQSVMGMGPGKKPEDRRVGNYESQAGDQQSYRAGAGLAIAALAMAARQAEGLEHTPADYLKAAQDVFDYLEVHNAELANDKKENMVDDYCALTAAAELYKTTKSPRHLAAAVKRAEGLLARLMPQGYWRVDDKDRPFFSPSDAGLPVVGLLDFHGIAPEPLRQRILDAVRTSLAYEMKVTGEVANPFGYARQPVQHKDGRRNTAFFFPHDTETAPWWQGENARLASLACAARLAAPFFPEDSAFQGRLRAYALDQLNWILGLNPYDACMLGGTGRNNPEYIFLGTWQYENVPGGVVNGITSGLTDERDIDYNVGYETTGVDHDWRWMEQWLPHTSWYMLAVAAGDQPAAPGPGKRPAVPNLAGKVLTVNGPLDPSALGPTLTHEHIFIKFKTPASVAGEPGEMTADQREKAELALAQAPKDWVDQGVDKPWAKGFAPGWNTLMDFDLQLAEVMEFKKAGGGAIVDVSNFGLTRSPSLLRRISEASGLHVVMGASWYEKAFHPRDMDVWTVDDMADIVVRDVTVGAQGTGIRAGVIGEIGVEGRPLTANEIKITRASARAARITGAPLHFHSGGGTPEEKQRILDIVAEEGFDLNHVIMGHNGSGDVALQRRITDRGAYVEFDGLGWGPDTLKPEAVEQLAQRIVSLIEGGLTDRILIAHDVCTNFQLKKNGGGGFGYISNLVVPALKAKGVSDAIIHRIMVDNPARAMTFVSPQPLNPKPAAPRPGAIAE